MCACGKALTQSTRLIFHPSSVTSINRILTEGQPATGKYNFSQCILFSLLRHTHWVWLSTSWFGRYLCPSSSSFDIILVEELSLMAFPLFLLARNYHCWFDQRPPLLERIITFSYHLISYPGGDIVCLDLRLPYKNIVGPYNSFCLPIGLHPQGIMMKCWIFTQ